MLAQDIASGRLVRLFEEHEPPSRPVNLLFIGGRRLTPKTRAFIDMLVADSACAAS